MVYSEVVRGWYTYGHANFATFSSLVIYGMVVVQSSVTYSLVLVLKLQNK
jgi:hypothetical protein